MNRLTLFVLLVGIALAGALRADAQPFTTIYSFGNAPANPRGNLTLGPDGNFYGTTAGGGQYGDGAVFRVTTNGNLMTLASFGSFLTDGTWPYAGLTLGADGNFYGATIAGGTNFLSGGTNNTGTIFRVTTNGALTTVASFSGFNGSYPECQLIIGPNGSFYGTTAYGGVSNLGTVFQVTTNGVLTTLSSFRGTNGAMPQAGLTLGLDGNFYGTTTYGGISNVGTIFQVTPGGNLKILVNFNNTNGALPYGQLRLGSDGDLYGTTSSGGMSTGPFQVSTNSYVGSFGTVFRVTTNGMLTTLADLTFLEGFSGIYPGIADYIGWNPYGQLIQGADGSFYGTTSGGGTNGSGIIFKVSTNGTLAQLATLPNLQYQFLTNFAGVVFVNYTTNNFTNSSLIPLLNASVKKLYDFPPLVNNTNFTGAASHSGLTLGPDGNFYAAVSGGGASGFGTIIRVATNGTVTPLASFSGNTGSGLRAGLTLGPDGSLYGAAQLGGVNGIGSLFKWSRDGSVSTLHSFDWRPDGANPNASLTLGPDGNLYGTALNGGTNLMQVGPNSYNALSYGTVFRLTTNGVFTPLVYFNGTNGANPYAALTLLDGNFYGTTGYGGISNSGTVFQLKTNGALTVLDNFTGANGSHPDGKLTVGPNGNLYGTTVFGGVSNVGTVFEISTQGPINTVFHFTGANGANPQAGLLWNSDGYFYGATDSGGSKKLGTVFKLTPGGALTTLASFGQTNANGSFPDGDLIKGPDGNLYGVTSQGGAGFNGTVFRLDANGTVTTLFSFPSTPLNSSFSSGFHPYSGLILFTNGNFIHLYGTAFGGGNNGGGTIFQVNLTTSYAVPENTSSLLNPLTNDLMWTTGGSLNLTGTSTTNGTAAINGTRILVLPATNFTGSATLAYTFTDSTGQTNTSLISLLVTNIPPIANPDSATVGENTAANPLSPLANDLVQTPGGTLGLVSVSTTNGTAVISGTNVLFTPATNFAGAVTVNYTVTDHIGGTNSSYITVEVTNVPSPSVADLSLSASAAPEPVGVGSNLVYSITVSNAGPSVATGVVISNQIPAGVNFVSATGGATPSGGRLLLNIGSLTNGAVTNVQVIMQPTTTGQLTNLFQVFANELDPMLTNNFTTVVRTVTNAAIVSADLSLSASTAPEPVGVGSNLVYSVTVSNAGPSVATGVVVSNPIPAGVNFVSATGGATPSGGVLLLNLGSLAEGTNTTVQIVISPNSAGPLTNLFEVFANETDPVPTNNSAAVVSTVTNPPPLPADLSLGGTNSAVATFTDSLVYYLSITNHGPGAATGVVVSNQIPAGILFVSATDGATPTNGILLLNLGTLALGAVTNLTVTLTPTNYNLGFLTNVFQVSANETDPVPANNFATFITQLEQPATQFTTSTAEYDTNQTTTVSLQLTNYSTELIAKLPDGTVVYDQTFAAAYSDPAVQAAITTAAGNLTNAGAATYSGPAQTGFSQTTNHSSVTVPISTNLTVVTGTKAWVGPVTIPVGNFGVVTGYTFDPVVTNYAIPTGGNPQSLTLTAGQTDYDTMVLSIFDIFLTTTNTATYTNSSVYTMTGVVAQADLQLTASAAPEPVGVGSNLVYTISITNLGPNTASGVVVSNRVSVNETFVSAAGGTTPSGGVLLMNLGSLTAGAVSSVQVIVQPTAAGKLTNIFEVFAITTDPVLTNNSATVVSTVTNAPPVTVDVALSLTAAPNPVGVGAPLTYSLTVTNNSSTTATGVVVSNTLPPNVSLFSLLPSQGSATNQGNVVTYSVGNLPNGDAATLAIVVLPEAAGLLTNLAMVTSAQTDSQPANNRATNVTTAVSAPITNLVLTVLSAITLNPQTGLFEQRIQVANGGPATPSSVLVTVSGLASNATLYDATGKTNGLPFVQSASLLGVGSNVVFLLEYYVPTRVKPTNLTFTVQAGPIVIPPVASGTILSVSRTLVLPNGNVLVEFGAVPGQVYAIQYSSDMITWLTAMPAITAPANRVQWIDAGPPQTVSSPAQQPARYYRVVRLTAH